jgi:uncharacterized membrane protein YedE/YeeE
MFPNFTPVSALVGGALIGLSAVLLLRLNGRIAGISGVLNGLFARGAGDRGWRLAFLLALIVGAALWFFANDGFAAPREGFPIAMLVGAGLLVGTGTRLGSGCTSGHGICGLSRLSKRSLVAVLVFMGTGFATVALVRHALGRG